MRSESPDCNCIHYWEIETTNALKAEGNCLRCGGRMMFDNQRFGETIPRKDPWTSLIAQIAKGEVSLETRLC